MSIFWIVTAICLLSSWFSASSWLLVVIRLELPEVSCSYSTSSILVYESSWEFLTLSLINSSLFWAWVALSFLTFSSKSIIYCSSSNLLSRTSLLLFSSSEVYSIRMTPFFFKLSRLVCLEIFNFLSSFLYLFLSISSVIDLPSIDSYISIPSLSIFLLSFRVSKITLLSTSLLVLRSLILFSATVISLRILVCSFYKLIVVSFCLFRRFGSAFLSSSS